jgi:hypothetical protein
MRSWPAAFVVWLTPLGLGAGEGPARGLAQDGKGAPARGEIKITFGEAKERSGERRGDASS